MSTTTRSCKVSLGAVAEHLTEGTWGSQILANFVMFQVASCVFSLKSDLKYCKSSGFVLDIFKMGSCNQIKDILETYIFCFNQSYFHKNTQIFPLMWTIWDACTATMIIKDIINIYCIHQQKHPCFADATVLLWALIKQIYRKVSNIRRTKFQNLNVSCILMQLSSLNSLKPGVKLIMKMLLEQRQQAMLQLHLSYQQFYCLLRCDLY